MSAPAAAFTEEQIKQFAEQTKVMAEQTARITLMETALAESKTATELAQSTAKQATERAAALEVLNQTRAFAEESRSWGGNVETDVPFLLALPADLLPAYRLERAAHAAQLKESGLFSEMGAAGAAPAVDAQERLHSMTEARAAKDGISYKEAARKVIRENPGIMAEAKKASEVRV